MEDRSLYYKAVREKRELLRKCYGGMMTLANVAQEFGYKDPHSAKKLIAEMDIPATRIGRLKRYETDLVAKAIVNGRGMV